MHRATGPVEPHRVVGHVPRGCRRPLDPPPDIGANLSDVFIDGTVGSFRLERAVYARPTLDGLGCATFAPEHKINGKVCGDRLIAGDFAPEAAVGLANNRSAFCTTAPITAGIP